MKLFRILPFASIVIAGIVFALYLSATHFMTNTHNPPKRLVHNQDNVNPKDIAATTILSQERNNITPLRPQPQKINGKELNAQKHRRTENELEENELEKRKENRADPGFQKQLEMMLRDPKTGLIPEGIGYREQEFIKMLPSRNGTVGKQFHEKRASGSLASNFTWQARGPWNVGGRTRGVAIDVSNENLLLAGGVGGGIWRSTNKGQSWTRIISTPPATSIAQDKRPGKQNIWYCGTGEMAGSGWPARQQGIFKSLDGGLTWQALSATVGKNNFAYIYTIALNPTNTQQDEILAATSEGIFRSTDGGVTWAMVLTVKGAFDFAKQLRTYIGISSNGVYYATMGGQGIQKIYRSVNGTVWTDITPPTLQISATFPMRGLVAIAPSNPNIIYVTFTRQEIGSGSVLFKYTYISGDGTGTGGVWEDRSNNLNSSAYAKVGTQTGWCMLLNVHPQDENILYWGGVHLLRSMDGFRTQNQIQELTGIHVDHHMMAFFSDGRIIEASDGGLIISTASGHLPGTIQWQSLNNGYVTGQFFYVSVDEKTLGSQVLMGGMQDNGTYLGTQNGMSSWQPVGGGDGSSSAITAFGQDKLLYSSNQSGMISGRYLLKPAGEHTLYSSIPIQPVKATGQLFINPFIVDPNNDSIMYYPAGKYLWRQNNHYAIPKSNYDNIQGWQQFLSPTQHNAITALSASKGATRRLYMGTDQGDIFRIENPHTGTPVFINISANKGLPAFGYCSSFAIDPTNSDRVLVIFSNYGLQSIFYTTDAGNTWQEVGGNLEPIADGINYGPACISAAIVNFKGQRTYFVGTSAGLFSTTALNGINTIWVLEDGVPPGIAVMNIAKRDADGFVAVGTHGAGVYSTFITTVSSIGVDQDVSTTLTAQIYPNPSAKGQTVYVRLTDVPEQSANVRIMDVFGKTAALVNGVFANGSLAIQVPNNIAEGAYILMVESKGSTLTTGWLIIR